MKISLTLITFGALLLLGCAEVKEKADQKWKLLNEKAEKLDSLVNFEINKVEKLDSMVNKEIEKVKRLDSVLQKNLPGQFMIIQSLE